MNKHIWVLKALIVMMVFALVGCTTTQVRVVEKNHYVQTEIDPIYLNDCVRVPSPTREEFKLMGQDERIDALTRTLLAQYKFTRLCSTDKENIRELIEKQKQVIADRNAAEEARVEALKKGESK